MPDRRAKSLGANELDAASDSQREELMKTIQALALLAGVFVAGCSERPSVTAPSAVIELTATDVTGDRPYTWSLSCGGKGPYGNPGSAMARWTWAVDGDSIPGSGGDAYCTKDKLTGSGVRPGNANGFWAWVNDGSQSWTFDPTQPFSTQLKVSSEYCYFNLQRIVCDKWWGLLRVDS
jgi:hypothetical protein